MRTLFCTLIAAFFVLAFCASCGKGRSPTGASSLTAATTEAQEASTTEPPNPFTDEDRMVMAMPLEERILYLDRRLKDLLFRRYGIVVEESALDAKNASLVDEYNKICVESAGADKELLVLDQTTGKWEWTLSFLDRLCGDYNFDHVVTVDDVDELGTYFNYDSAHEDWDEAPCHIDRLANDDGKISIADVTAIAQNFGHQLQGYNLYWQDYTGGNWRLIGEWEVGSSYMESDPPYENHRAQWEGTFTKKSVYRYYSADPITIDTTTYEDKLHVKPVFYTNDVQDVPSDQLDIEWSGENDPPVADITADPMVADLGEQVDYDASGSTDPDEDTLYYEWDVNAAPGYQWISTGTTATTSSAYYYNTYLTATVCVTDEVGDWDTDSVQIQVYEIADPEPPTILDFTLEPLEATLPATISFTTEAQDRDGDTVVSISFDPDGDLDYEDVFTEEDDEFTLLNPGDPPAARRYQAAYDVEYNRSDDCISDSSHTTNLACRTKATDNDEGDGTAVPVILRLTHASPVINSISLTNEVGMYVRGTPVTVTIDASDASDPDSASDFPTKFEFFFGDGQSYSETEGSASDGTFDGITTHDYTNAGVFQIAVTCWDDDHTSMGGSCTTPSAHTFTYDWSTDEDEDGKVRIWSIPSVLDDDEEIDAGTGSDYVGEPCIAVAINPQTGWPGVVYSANPTTNQGLPAEVAKFSEKTQESGGWTTPEMVWTGSEFAEHLGYQCDLEYHPTVYSGDAQLPHIVQYFYNQFPNPGGSGGPGIKLFTKMDGDWECDVLVDDGTVDPDSPIRLVVNNVGSFAQFVGEDASEDVALNEIAFKGELSFTKNSYIQVQSLGSATNVGMSHDLKQYQDNYGSSADTRASLYSIDGSSDDVQYEVWTGSSWLGASPALNWEGVDTGITRHVALDYLGDSEIGAIWVDDDGDLKWAKYTTSWSSETQLRATVGDWCDFDYEPVLGVPCVAYEEDGYVYLLVYVSSSWQNPIQVHQLNQGEESHLDLDVHDGYVFIAFSHDDGVYCAVLDFYGGNR